MIEVQFEQSPWELFLQPFSVGSSVSAVSLLSVLEGEDDDAVDAAFQMIEEKELSLELTGFPKPGAFGQAALRLKQEEEIIKHGLHPEDFEITDPLRLYLEEVASIPAFGDEELLAQHYLAGNQDSAIALTNLGLSHVISIAQEYVGYGVLLLDLIQEGSIGLWQGIQSFHGNHYGEHRNRMIHNAIKKAIFLQARNIGIGQKMRQALQDYRSADEKLLIEIGRNPSLEEIAAEIHMTAEDAEVIRKMLENAILLQQTQKASQPQEEPEPEDEMAVEDTPYFQMRQRITDLLSQLSEEDAKLLSLRFGLEKGLPASPEEIARHFGITAAEVSSREAAALAKLRQYQ